MLSIGLHCRLVGRPARAAALARFLDYVQRTTMSGSRAASISRGTGKNHPFGGTLRYCKSDIFADIQKIIRGRAPDDNLSCWFKPRRRCPTRSDSFSAATSMK
jgi:hypothetical protein